WFHLLRHSCASSLISGWWGHRWLFEDVQQVLGHADIRMTQRYAHLAPAAVQATAAKAQAAFQLAKIAPARERASCHAVVTPRRGDRGSPRNRGRARQDSNLRPTAPEAVALSN